ncbi:MAG: MFS transporter [Acidaminobacter sp.]|uniref:MFS transporter n=1 Tax=Acidaminobacter sp. TaxID=1872102 RepID=UPI00138088A2|nr:MFS transporter [Acidaminobacter sp.]MZQ98066.1 MFS transporter [Acidaminobacter sp.]
MSDSSQNMTGGQPVMLFCFMTGAFWFSQYAYMPQLTKYASQIGASMQTIGLISGAYGFSQVLLRVPLGLYSDYLGRRKIFVLIGITMTVLSPLIVLLAPHPNFLIAARFFTGVAAATWVNITVMFSEYFKNSESTKAIGIINSTNRLGQLSAFIIGGIVVAAFEVRAAFVLSAVMGTIALVAGFRIKETGSKSKAKKTFNLKDIFLLYKNRRLVSVSLLGLLSQLITFSTVFSFTPLLATELGAESFHLNLYNILFILPQIFFATLSGTVIRDRFGEKATLTAGFALVTLSCIMIPFLNHYVQLFPIMLLSGIGTSMSFPLLMGIAIKDVDIAYKSSAMGFYQSVYAVGMTIGPILIGMVSGHFGLTAGFMTVAGIGLLALAAVQLPAAGIEGKH